MESTFRIALLLSVSIAWGTVESCTLAAENPASAKAELKLPIQFATCVAELPDGTTAFGQYDGLTVYHRGTSKTFTGGQFALPVGEEVSGNSDLPGNRIECLFAGRDGSIWVGTDRGLACWREGTLKDMTPRLREVLPDSDARPRIMSLYETSSGEVCIGMLNARLVIFDPKEDKFSFVPFAEDRKLSEPPGVNNWIRGIAEDPEKGLWVCVQDFNLLQVSNRQIRELPAKRSNWKTSNEVQSFCFDRENNLWMGTNAGLELHRKDGTSRTFTDADGLPENFVSGVRTGDGEKLWITMVSGHVCTFDGREFLYSELEITDPDNPPALFQSRSGMCWICSAEESIRTPNVAWVKASPFDRAAAKIKAEVEAEYPNVRSDRRSAIDKQGRVWTGVMGRVLRFDGKEWAELPDLTPPPHRPDFGPIAADSNGRILICSDEGLLVYDRDQGTLLGRPNTSSSVIYDIAQSKDGTVYVGTQGGLYRFDGTMPALIPMNEEYQVMRLAVDESGAIWFADPNDGLFLHLDSKSANLTNNIPLQAFGIESLEPLPRRGVRIRAVTGDTNSIVRVTYHFDGETIVPLSGTMAALGLIGQDDPQGCKIERVFRDSAAGNAHLVAGEIITDIDGERIQGTKDLTSAMEKRKVGDVVTVGILRDGARVQTKVQLK